MEPNCAGNTKLLTVTIARETEINDQTIQYGGSFLIIHEKLPMAESGIVACTEKTYIR